MRYRLFLLLIAVISSNALAQESPEPAPKNSRDAIIRSALARDHGDITAMEGALRDGGGVFIGYSSGAVVNCRSDEDCRAFSGTPSSAVTGAVQGLALSYIDGTEIVWVAYPHGVIYRCVDDFCRQFDASTGGVD